MKPNLPPPQAWWISQLLDRHPDDALWACAGRTVTYGELRAQVTASARLAGSYGIGPGSTVALRGAAGFTQLWTLLALWSVGAQVMLMGPSLEGDDLGALLDRCRPRHLLTLDGPARPDGAFQDECGVLVRRLASGMPARTDHCLVQFTSGSTALAKAVGRDADSLRAETDRFAALPGMPGAGERVLLLSPTAHSFGLVGGVLHAMNTGAVLVFPSTTGRGGPGAVDAVLAAPRHFAALAEGPHQDALRGLRTAVSAGDTLDAAVRLRFAERYGVRVGQAYGTTETGIVAADPAGEHGPDAVGPPAPGVRVRVHSGELQVWLPRSPYLFEQQPPARFVSPGGGATGGWLCTRDMVARDPGTGAIRLLGRFDPLRRRALPSEGHTQRQIAMRTLVRRLERSGRTAR
ncbi:class I adenylate-forming enzyme family protein [Kitasatospora phosalacinea]|uniref:class I adenylate-forming enzyme family protein n=1 Tax=Kitasatospora phosalacinea TaxID=2065 RepID=UPI0036532CE0